MQGKKAWGVALIQIICYNSEVICIRIKASDVLEEI
jgi:hypothetical protein